MGLCPHSLEAEDVHRESSLLFLMPKKKILGKCSLPSSLLVLFWQMLKQMLLFGMVGSHLFGIHLIGLVSKRADSLAGPLGKILGCSHFVFYNPSAALGSWGRKGRSGWSLMEPGRGLRGMEGGEGLCFSHRPFWDGSGHQATPPAFTPLPRLHISGGKPSIPAHPLHPLVIHI